MIFDRRLVITTTAYHAGRLTIRALLGRRVLGRCEALTPAKREFTCHIKLPSKVSLRAHIAIAATLKEGPHESSTIRLAARVIPQMKMVPIGSKARVAAVAGFWCSPSMLVATLAYESSGVSHPAVPSRPRRLAS
jgi:hypothetical protein